MATQDTFDHHDEEISADEYAAEHGFGSYKELDEEEYRAVVEESNREDERFAFFDEDDYEFYDTESLYENY